MTGNVFRPLFCLLAFLIVFTKYGEPIAKFISINGDINLAMFEHAIKATDTIGFVYDDRNGAFVLNSRICTTSNRGTRAFIAQDDCSVKAKVTYEHTPDTYSRYFREHEENFPARNTGSNLLIGKLDEGGPIRIQFAQGVSITGFPDVITSDTIPIPEIYCNDKSNSALQELFQFDNNGYLAFKSNEPTNYEQTMKCLVLYKLSSEQKLGKLFVMIIGNLREQKFIFHPSELTSMNAATYEPDVLSFAVKNENFENTSGNVESFVFVADSSNGCPPNITISSEKEDEKISVTYDGSRYVMPPIRSDANSYCGIANMQKRGESLTKLKYFCECNQ